MIKRYNQPQAYPGEPAANKPGRGTAKQADKISRGSEKPRPKQTVASIAAVSSAAPAKNPSEAK